MKRDLPLIIDVAVRSAVHAAVREVDDDTLAQAVEHLTAAVKSLPDPQAEDGERAEAIVKVHAHVKAADSYLEKIRSRSVPLAGDGDGDAELAEAMPDDAESRAIRQTTRAAAAVTLLAGGATAAAKRLARLAPKPRNPRK